MKRYGYWVIVGLLCLGAVAHAQEQKVAGVAWMERSLHLLKTHSIQDPVNGILKAPATVPDNGYSSPPR